MRIVYMGTPDFAVPSLRILSDHGYDIVAVVTAPDKPAGRGLQLSPSPVKVFAQSRGFRILQPEKLRDPAFQDELRSLNPDLGVVVAFRMLPESVWAMPRLGTLNLHASLLPDYRGAAPINWAIINGETRTGATTFLLNHKIDEGAMLQQMVLPLGPDTTAGELHDELMEKGARLVLETVQALEKGTAVPRPQPVDGQHHPAPKIFRETCCIDWTRTRQQVHNLIRGLSPWPGAWTTLHGKTLKIFRASVGPEAPGLTPGNIITSDGVFQVACADGYLNLHTVQLEGKSRMEVPDFLRGYKGELVRVN